MDAIKSRKPIDAAGIRAQMNRVSPPEADPYGVAIALLDSRLPGKSSVAHGVALGAIGWLAMMLALMPMAGAGLFGMSLGAMAPVVTLVLHLIFGAVLGWYYGRSTRHATESIAAG